MAKKLWVSNWRYRIIWLNHLVFNDYVAPLAEDTVH